MLLQMLTERGTLTFGQSLLLSGIGMIVVLMELAILAVMIIFLSKVLASVTGKNAAPAAVAAGPAPAPVPKAAAPAPAPAAPAAPAAPVRPAGLVLENVDEPTAATLMAIISDRTGIPLNRLAFHSIKGAPVVLEGIDEETAAVVMAIVSKETGIPMNRLSFQSIKKVD